MEVLYQADIAQVSGGATEADARIAFYEKRLEGMFRDRAKGNPFPYHNPALYCLAAAIPLSGTALYLAKYSVSNSVQGAIEAMTTMEFIQCDERGCCCPA